MATSVTATGIDEFLKPLRVNSDLLYQLSQEFTANFKHLAAESTDQFLPTPISESLLRPVGRNHRGR